MEPEIGIAKRRKRLRTLLIVTLLLCLVIFRPTMSWAIQQLLPRAPVKLGTAEVVIPKTWMLSRKTTRVYVWKPCSTVFCRSLPASFVLEVSDLPEDAWEDSAKKTLHDAYSGEILTKTIPSDSGQLKCVETNSVSGAEQLVASCFNSDLHLESTFAGKPSLGPAFYAVLVRAHKGT